MKNNVKFIPVFHGEIADGMLDGTFCQCCGVFIGSDCGYPISCDDCEDEEY